MYLSWLAHLCFTLTLFQNKSKAGSQARIYENPSQAGGVAQVVEPLPSKTEALSSNYTTAKKLNNNKKPKKPFSCRPKSPFD
jgi:hypothetical protein